MGRKKEKSISLTLKTVAQESESMMNFTFLQAFHYLLNIAIAFLLVFDLGYRQKVLDQFSIDVAYVIGNILLLTLTILRNRIERQPRERDKISVIILSILLGLTLLMVLRRIHAPLDILFASVKQLLVGGLFIYLFYTLSKATRVLYQKTINPALLFVSSFAILILLGSLLLTLPQATTKGISFIDALFTSTSAVSVTGLAVLDTGKDFTLLGQSIILVLIQLGGLGVLTITSFFAYFFRAGSTFREGVYVKEMISSDSISGVLGLAARIVVFTFAVEIIGALLIFFSLEEEIGLDFDDRLFFSIFHSIASFCNAGFSTMTNNLYQEGWQFNYNLHLAIATLFIIGGLGFGIMFNFFVYFKAILKRFRNKILYRSPFVMPIRVITLNSKIVLVTTFVLLGIGTVFFFFVEYDNTLSKHTSFYGKIAEAFFLSATPRTAGFNTVDMLELTTPSILLTLLLMWIGASPGSTGGGIKTSTFAIATLNILAIARGRTNMVIGTREISRYSVERAFAILSLSLIVIGFSVFFISIFEPEKDLLPIAFECFSAYGTVGLSLNFTASLSDPSKIVVILTMFIGRIGAINMLIGMLRQVATAHHQYPSENILIN